MIVFLLHDVVFPAESAKEGLLYLRPIGGEIAGPGPVRLGKGMGVSTDTYFGVFPLAQWTRMADLGHLALRLRGTGAIEWVVTTLAAPGMPEQMLATGETALDGEAVVELSPGSLESGAAGLYLRLTSKTETVLNAISFLTHTPPARRVDLGLVITTFGRAALARTAIANLEAIIEQDCERSLGAISLTVVDNGREILPSHCPFTTVLPNANLGGAGGFARGLSHQANAGATHACFMDDDAATEGECVLRIRRMLAYATDDRTAVSGAMLRAETSFMMHEQGAVIEWARNHRIISRKNGLDLRLRESIAETLVPEPTGYGGWWLFAFPIRPDLRFPYPLFVRGDDWLFSYLNRFSIETGPGICSWQEGFENKIGPIEQYLAMKAFLVAEILLRRPANPFMTVWYFARWILRNLSGYCYDRAMMNCEALEDTLRGPVFWERNVSLGPRLGTLRKQVVAETMQPATTEMLALPIVRQGFRERKWRKGLRFATLNGQLAPMAILRPWISQAIAGPRNDAPQPVLAFLRRCVVYRDSDSLEAFVAVRDTPRFIAIGFRAMKLLVRLAWELPTLQRTYARSVDRLCTKAWWEGVFASEGQDAPERNRAA